MPHIDPKPITHIAEKYIRLRDFQFHKGYIVYKQFIFIHEKICPLHRDWVKHCASISSRQVRILIFPSNREQRKKRILFEFGNKGDLKTILEICKNFSQAKGIIDNGPKIQGTTDSNQKNDRTKSRKPKGTNKRNATSERPIPWRHVTFGYYKLTINCNIFGGDSQNTYTYRDTKLVASFNKIKDYIERSCPQLVANVKDGNIVGVSNFEPLLNLIPQLRDRMSGSLNVAISDGNVQKSLRSWQAYSLDVLKARTEFSKSPYLAHLSKIHLVDSKVYYLLESVNHESNDSSHDEFGYLFTLKNVNGLVTLLFENITDESRASLVFVAVADKLQQAIVDIKNFLSSSLRNKRQLLANRMITFTNESIIRVSRI